ncbi:cytochrome-c peroxidase [Ascidiimonas aurantiaca]|uniref:cytochrome-c peroxidase n=1 Tax=Ascidiimonas aurantiaca TaxID=1685432 RepID=UPI0030EDB749
MKKIGFSIVFAALLGFTAFKVYQPYQYDINELRVLYSSGDTAKWPAPFLDSTLVQDFEDIGVVPEVVFPEENLYSETKKELGRTLFFDPRLSRSGQIACASCHDPELGWGDGRRVSYGHDRQQGKRNAMTLFYVGLAQPLFWDGRAATLESQVRFPVEDSLEMNFHLDLAVKRIQHIQGYRSLFKEAFLDTVITEKRIRKAIATFERTIKGRTSRFDRFVQGDSTQLTDEEVWGMHLFRTKARCINCHNTGYFSDNHFHNTGLSYYGRPFEDLGLYNITGKKEDVGKFRTGTLREIGQTGPYMHNGLFLDLDEVINAYNGGMLRPRRKKSQEKDTLFPVTSPLLKKLHLTGEEKEALKAFLGTLTTAPFIQRIPDLPAK